MFNLTIFIADSDRIYNVIADVHGNEILFPLDEPNACLNSGLNCPLEKNQTYKYTKTLPVRIYYPPVILVSFRIILFMCLSL